jgi:hypothetical protein
MSLSIAEAVLLQDLKRRVEALEQGRRSYRSGLVEHNARRARAAAKTAPSCPRCNDRVVAAAPPDLETRVRELDLEALGCPNLSPRNSPPYGGYTP